MSQMDGWMCGWMLPVGPVKIHPQPNLLRLQTLRWMWTFLLHDKIRMRDRALARLSSILALTKPVTPTSQRARGEWLRGITGVDTGRYVIRYLPESTYLLRDLPTCLVWQPWLSSSLVGGLVPPSSFFLFRRSAIAPPPNSSRHSLRDWQHLNRILHFTRFNCTFRSHETVL